MTFTYLLIFTIALFASPLCTTAQEKVCVRDDQCDPGYCCAISEMRYSKPACRKMRTIEESCRPEPIKIFDAVYAYPNGEKIKVEEIYYGFCPCETGTHCSRVSGSCEKN